VSKVKNNTKSDKVKALTELNKALQTIFDLDEAQKATKKDVTYN